MSHPRISRSRIYHSSTTAPRRRHSTYELGRASTLGVWLLLVALGGLLGHPGTLDAQERPNIVLIMVDDMGFSDLGCYGSEIDTPNLDRIASQGMRFTQFYNCAKCETTRRTLLTGNYHPEVNLAQGGNITLAELLGRAGYHTMMTGKWHIRSTPTERGFNRYFGHLSGATDFFVGDNTFRLDDQPFEVPREGFYTTRANTDYAIEFLEEAEGQDQPFFLYIAYNAPHYPLQAPREAVEKYRGRYLDGGWEKLRQTRYERQKQLRLFEKPWQLSPPHPEARTWDSLSQEQREIEDLKMATFAAMVDLVDQNVGRLEAKLKAMGEWENTLFLFLSDNGACPFDRTSRADLKPWEPRSHWCYDQSWANACNTPLRWFKQNQHEGGISTPLIAHWPGKIQANQITHYPGHLVDIMATLADVSGTEYPAEFNGQTLRPLRGKSLVPILEGSRRIAGRNLFFQFRNNRAVRQGDWKLVSARGGPWELYHLARDRTELHDLAEDYPERVERMAAAWDEWARDTGLSKPKKSGK